MRYPISLTFPEITSYKCIVAYLRKVLFAYFYFGKVLVDRSKHKFHSVLFVLPICGDQTHSDFPSKDIFNSFVYVTLNLNVVLIDFIQIDLVSLVILLFQHDFLLIHLLRFQLVFDALDFSFVILVDIQNINSLGSVWELIVL